jgi:RNA ligase (TIGR02306 family)
MLKIEKWEPEISAQLSGQVKSSFPSIIPKTDEERIQNVPEILDELKGIECYWTIKMDGTSGTFVNYDNDHHVCSRNFSLKETEGNTYWEMYHKYNIKNILNDNPYVAIQGEVAGGGIQKDRAGLKDHHLFIFNLYDIKEGKILGYYDMKNFCEKYNLEMVPLFKIETFNYSNIDELVEISKECKYSNDKLGEGYVIRPIVPQYSKTLNGRMSIKVINPIYLCKNDA